MKAEGIPICVASLGLGSQDKIPQAGRQNCIDVHRIHGNDKVIPRGTREWAAGGDLLLRFAFCVEFLSNGVGDPSS